MKKIIFVGFVIIMLMSGCSSNHSDSNLISYMDAKEKIINNGAILIDVRTEEEYNETHIQGAVLLDVDKINENSAKDIISAYDSEVIVYCKSGNRSSQAKEILENLGYTNVYDLGSMSNWKE